MNKTYGPYLPYQTASNLIFTAGHIGVENGHAPPNIKAQTKLALANLTTTLEEAGSSLASTLKTTVFLVNMTHFKDMNTIYEAVFTSAGCRPARTTVAIKELPRVADNALLIEIEAIALQEQL